MDKRKLIQLILHICDTHIDLYLTEKRSEEKLLQDIQLANSLKTWLGAKKGDGTEITVGTRENVFNSHFPKNFICFHESPLNVMRKYLFHPKKFFSFSNYLNFCLDFLVI